jgi:hypothetical protein
MYSFCVDSIASSLPFRTGIPLGLGAGFKLKDKDREREKEGSQEPESILPSSSHGWTAILEDWYCHGGNSAQAIVKRHASFLSIPESLALVSDAMYDLKRRRTVNSPPERRGPYEILIKERMMGLYLAVYIHRDIKHLVRGNDCLSHFSLLNSSTFIRYVQVSCDCWLDRWKSWQ